MIINRLKRKFFQNLVLARIVLLTVIITVISGLIFGIFRLVRPLTPYLIGQNLVSSQNRTNFLVLGIRGQGSDGPDMTDTMILASLSHQTGQITLISLPRDYYSEVIKAKINSAYHLGYVKQATSGGLLLAKTVISELSGVPVHYAVVIDFSLFTKFIDLLGGVNLDVPKSFDDFKYPIPGKENDLCNGDPQTLCRYEHLHFEAGNQHMDGALALKYVRSRQSTDLSEGTDFARSRRQEQLISALKSSLLSQPPKTYLSLYRLIVSSVITDINPQNYLPLARLLLKSKDLPLKNYSLNQDNLLDNPPTSETYDYQWVLIPKNNKQESVRNFFQEILL